MAKLSDDSPEAFAIRAAQAQRLERLRMQMGLNVQQAADRAGVSRFSWTRMETAKANIDAVALARFVTSLQLPAEYVVTGGLAGLPDPLARDLVQLEALETAAQEGRIAPALEPSRRGRKRQRSTTGSDSEATPNEAPQTRPTLVRQGH